MSPSETRDVERASGLQGTVMSHRVHRPLASVVCRVPATSMTSCITQVCTNGGSTADTVTYFRKQRQQRIKKNFLLGIGSWAKLFWEWVGVREVDKGSDTAALRPTNLLDLPLLPTLPSSR